MVVPRRSAAFATRLQKAEPNCELQGLPEAIMNNKESLLSRLHRSRMISATAASKAKNGFAQI